MVRRAGFKIKHRRDSLWQNDLAARFVEVLAKISAVAGKSLVGPRERVRSGTQQPASCAWKRTFSRTKTEANEISGLWLRKTGGTEAR